MVVWNPIITWMTDDELGKFNGYNNRDSLFNPITTTGRNVLIYFSSDYAYSDAGFDLTVTLVKQSSGPATGFTDAQKDEVQCTKVIRDGQLLIIRDGKTYNAQGIEVK